MSKPKERSSFVCACAAIVLLAPITAIANGVTREAMLANSCAICHGTDGKGAKKIPRLKGEDAEDLKESLEGFQAGTEKATIMDRQAKAYTDEEIKAVVGYFSGLH